MQGFCLALHRRCALAHRGLGTRQVTPQLDKRTAKKRIELTFGKYAIVDAEDYDWLNSFKWCAVRKRNTWYAKTLRLDGGRLSMHRLIAGAPRGLLVDHIDHNGLNNRKYNLRLCTNAQNQYNRLPLKGSTSRHKGVSWCRSHNKYNAAIYHKSKRYHLGWFVDPDKAVEHCLHAIRQRFIGEIHVGKERVAAGCRHVMGV